MIHPIPSGTRDVLPDEMRELRAITEAFRNVFESSGYGEIATPALEYESVLTRGDPAAADPAYRLFDEHGKVLVLRSDMTIPIARVVATRYAHAEPPLRFCYFAHAYRSSCISHLELSVSMCCRSELNPPKPNTVKIPLFFVGIYMLYERS